jgi:Ethanolamine utilization protein EutJ (predicted chaperonin)
MAIVYAELGDKQFSGIGISFGAGAISFCLSELKTEIISFSSTNAGDWITDQVSKVTGESFLNIEEMKKNIDLNSSDSVLKNYYQLMIKETVENIKKAVLNKKSDKPIDIIVAGGAALATGFIDLFRKELFSANLPIKLGEIRRSEDSLYTVARGCLIAAETSEV